MSPAPSPVLLTACRCSKTPDLYWTSDGRWDLLRCFSATKIRRTLPDSSTACNCEAKRFPQLTLPRLAELPPLAFRLPHHRHCASPVRMAAKTIRLAAPKLWLGLQDRKSTRLNSSH